MTAEEWNTPCQLPPQETMEHYDVLTIAFTRPVIGYFNGRCFRHFPPLNSGVICKT